MEETKKIIMEEEPKKIIMDDKIEQQINSMMGCNGAIEASKFNVNELYPNLNNPKKKICP
jgi:hypothetical protein